MEEAGFVTPNLEGPHYSTARAERKRWGETLPEAFAVAPPTAGVHGAGLTAAIGIGAAAANSSSDVSTLRQRAGSCFVSIGAERSA